MGEGTKCGGSCGFNYCFWAKLLVAIPALPLAAIVVASAFENSAAQLVSAGVTIFVLVWLAVMVDRIPGLQKKIGNKDCKS
jgi:hypothetical protein